MKSMRRYPFSIIPKAAYKKQLDFIELTDKYPDLLVLRLVSGNESEFYSDGPGPKELTDRIFSGTVQNLSMNLLGGKYKLKHYPFIPKNDGASDPWNGKKVDISRYKDSYQDISLSFYVCFNVRDIDRKPYPFSVTFNDENERDIMKTKIEASLSERQILIDHDVVGKFISKTEKVDVEVYMQLVHRPNNLNYWHVTLDTTRLADTEYIMPNEHLSTRGKRQLKAFKQHLMELINRPDRVPYIIRLKDYYEKMTLWDRLFDMSQKLLGKRDRYEPCIMKGGQGTVSPVDP